MFAPCSLLLNVRDSRTANSQEPPVRPRVFFDWTVRRTESEAQDPDAYIVVLESQGALPMTLTAPKQEPVHPLMPFLIAHVDQLVTGVVTDP